MKKLLITYKMLNQNGVAENCVALPMLDDIAKDILLNGADSVYLNYILNGEVGRLLKSLAEIQGYDYAGFCTADEIAD